MTDKIIIILVGNIGNGKSTIVKELVDRNYICVCRDQIRYAIGGGTYKFDKKLESSVWNIETQMLHEFMKKDFNIVVDEVGVSKQYRSKYIELAKKYGYKSIVMVLPRLSMKESVDRRMKNPHGQPDRKLWEEVWTKFNNKYQEPSLDEGMDKIIHL